MISVVVPTYNESKNIGVIIEGIGKALAEEDYEIVVVDDNSKDGTAEKAMKLGRKYPVRVIVRKNEHGLSSAILRGFMESKGDIIGVMDADLQHPPEFLPKIIAPLKNDKADISIGSRYVKGGQVENWPIHRRIISRGARLLAMPLTRVKDCVSGFFFAKKKILDKLELNPLGYKLGLEIFVKSDGRIVEVPFTFRTRKEGASKLGGKVMWEYIKQLWGLYRE